MTCLSLRDRMSSRQTRETRWADVRHQEADQAEGAASAAHPPDTHRLAVGQSTSPLRKQEQEENEMSNDREAGVNRAEYTEKVADELHELGCTGSMNGVACFCSRDPGDADHLQANVAVLVVLRLERDRHTSDGRTDCGARAPWEARWIGQRSQSNSRSKGYELHCTGEPTHRGAHKDALHSWTFWSFDEKDVTHYAPRNLSKCRLCGTPFPCEEYDRLTRMITEDEKDAKEDQA